MWLPVLIGTAATAVAIPLTLVLADRSGAEGVAISSTVMMWTYTAAMAVAWWRGTGRTRRLALLDALARGVIPAVAAGLIGRQLSQRLSHEALGPALGTAAVAGIVVVIVYLLVSRLFRFTEADPRTWRRSPLS
jgi:uncharacterized membrane protein YfcA